VGGDMKSTGSPFMDIGRLRAFLKKTFCKKNWKITQLEQQVARY
jgi:hypothetical protein